MPDKHYLYGGSTADIWMNCNGAMQFSRLVPHDPPGEAAERGTRIHDFANRMWQNLSVSGNEEEIAIATKYVYDIKEKFGPLKCGTQIEDHFCHPSPELSSQCGGTVDGWAYSDNTLYVWDLKTGKHKVIPYGNNQLLFYAYLVSCNLPNNYVSTLHLGIHQNGKFTWAPPMNEDVVIAKFKYMSTRLDTMLTSNALSLSAGDHCLWCKAKPRCWENQKITTVKQTVNQMLSISDF